MLKSPLTFVLLPEKTPDNLSFERLIFFLIETDFIAENGMLKGLMYQFVTFMKLSMPMVGIQIYPLVPTISMISSLWVQVRDFVLTFWQDGPLVKQI